jgi:vitamin B12 transporter
MFSIFARAARPVLLVACGMPFASLAQSIDPVDRNALTTLAPVVVTATRAPEPLADSIGQTSLFDAQDIADTNASDALGLLALAPGVQVTRNGGPGATSGLYVRGASSAQSLVLIDGVRVESAGLGAAQLSQLMLDEIDRIEVVNGNVSALYGSGAIGGVVQIFTKEGGNHPPRVNVEAEYGSYHTQRQQFGVNGALDREGRTTFDFTVSREKTDSFSSIDPAVAPGAKASRRRCAMPSLTSGMAAYDSCSRTASTASTTPTAARSTSTNRTTACDRHRYSRTAD